MDSSIPVTSTELPNLSLVSLSGGRRRRLRRPKPANTYYVTLRVKATDSSFASKPADRLEVTTPDALLIDGPAGAVSFEAKGTYGQTLAQIQVRLAEKFKVVNYGRTEVSGNWHFIERQGGMSASSFIRR